MCNNNLQTVSSCAEHAHQQQHSVVSMHLQHTNSSVVCAICGYLAADRDAMWDHLQVCDAL
ncbi:hypothetical protein DL89DRAFT_264539 [Linderina pennispora]|uniref:C2H2-type domain-containing protein n=1 Tax=Linderina pennispora TaxID=61395 RepID=A0A1Y1WMI8_9FUNG|nr:uncharacterized protein DL89DRAFT_264539 [Linderina pennispora]ORX74733.1 hypothetical protein DL89DRAFT_264539 [Linderina pennispora]